MDLTNYERNVQTNDDSILAVGGVRYGGGCRLSRCELSYFGVALVVRMRSRRVQCTRHGSNRAQTFRVKG